LFSRKATQAPVLDLKTDAWIGNDQEVSPEKKYMVQVQKSEHNVIIANDLLRIAK
jgi:hypothetical protein